MHTWNAALPVAPPQGSRQEVPPPPPEPQPPQPPEWVPSFLQGPASFLAAQVQALEAQVRVLGPPAQRALEAPGRLLQTAVPPSTLPSQSWSSTPLTASLLLKGLGLLLALWALALLAYRALTGGTRQQQARWVGGLAWVWMGWRGGTSGCCWRMGISCGACRSSSRRGGQVGHIG